MRQLLENKIAQWDLLEKRVLLRIDANVPLVHGTVFDFFKLEAVKPTLNFLQSKGARVTIVTHLGNPKVASPQFSTTLLLPWFDTNGYEIAWAENVADADSLNSKKQFVLLENLRFFAGEKGQDKSFAQELASCGEYFVCDAFGTLHRNDSSTSILPTLYQENRRSIGFLIENELQNLTPLLNPEQPFLIILGGGKPESKLKLVEKLANHAETILLCPSLSNAPEAEQLKTYKNVIFPLDYQTREDKTISIGPKTVALYCDYIKGAKTILWNGMSGFLEHPVTLSASIQLGNAIAASAVYTVIAGGDTTAFVRAYCCEWKKFRFLSTGGGATLQFISYKRLPGLEFL